MTEAGRLTFAFDADFSGFARAADSAGAKLDQLGQAATRLTSRSASFSGDDQAARVLTRLTEQLALLQTTGTAHAAIAEQMKIEAAQAKLGSDATDTQRAAAASLVQQIDAATVAQAKLHAAQQATNDAWRFGSAELADGIDALILRGESLKSVAASLLESFSRAGLAGALTGTGPFAGLFGTKGSDGATGGLFGAIGSIFTGGSGFGGLFAGGGSIEAGQWGIVGEKGAEVVAGPAAVVPWGKLAGQAQAQTSQVIQFNVTTPDAPSFARSESQMASLVSRAVSRGQRNG